MLTEIFDLDACMMIPSPVTYAPVTSPSLVKTLKYEGYPTSLSTFSSAVSLKINIKMLKYMWKMKQNHIILIIYM